MKSFHKKLLSLSIVIALLLVAPVIIRPAFAEDSTLILGVHPYLPEEVLQARFKPLAEYLSHELNRPVIIKVSRSYQSHIENIGNRHYDISFMGPASYVTLSKQYDKPLLIGRIQVNGKSYFNGYIVTRKNSGISTLEQLKDRSFAFGSPNSTMSYLVPKYMLEKAGIKLDQLSNYEFLGDHKNVALSVLLGKFDAGAVKEEVYFDFKQRGLVHIAKTPNIPEHLFVAKGGMSDTLYNKVKNLFSSLNYSEEGLSILKSIKSSVSGIEEAKDSDYNILRMMIN